MTLHPQAQSFVDQIAEQNRPGWHTMSAGEARALFDEMKGIFGRGPELHSVEDRKTDGGVAVRVYRPTDSTDLPVVVYFHGGGWVLGNIESHDSVCRNIAKAADAVVVSVEYRLAPENKYPAAFHDCYAATKWVADEASALGVDANRLIVAGDSAGGNLAAAVAIKARDRGGPAICKQVLIYPVIEPDFTTDSYLSCAEGHGLTRETMQWFWEQYSDGDAESRYACLANANVENLPSAFVLTAEYDVLRDEGENYAARMKSAGVDVTVKRYAGMLHGFVHFCGYFDDAKIAFVDIAKELSADTR